MPVSTLPRRWMGQLLQGFGFDAGDRIMLGEGMDAIERASGRESPKVIRALASASKRISMLGKDTVKSFLDNMWDVSTRVRNPHSLLLVINIAIRILEVGQRQGRGPEEIAHTLNRAIGDLKPIAKNVKDQEHFRAICIAMEHLEDLQLISRYVNYMVSASGQIRGEENPSGTIKSSAVLAKQADAIAETAVEKGPDAANFFLTLLINRFRQLTRAAEPESS